ncbi:hypothetical protein LCGC14_2810850 [marine sediment metagenome]|uniref:Recombination endonuclease VII n=1 Tax=marine sediment metagenome TaxID=412755 RepID=A0A0F9BB88_9ZZZZ
MKQCEVKGCSNVARNNGHNKRGKLCETHHRRKYPRNAVYYHRAREAHVLRLYGIGKQEYRSILKKQSNNCSICGNGLDKPYIDHCHTSGKVRGVLCNACNWGLGHFKEDLDLLAAAASYLINSRLKEVG